MICVRIQGGGYLVTSAEPFCDYYLSEKSDSVIFPPMSISEGMQLAVPVASILIIVGLIKKISELC